MEIIRLEKHETETFVHFKFTDAEIGEVQFATWLTPEQHKVVKKDEAALEGILITYMPRAIELKKESSAQESLKIILGDE